MTTTPPQTARPPSRPRPTCPLILMTRDFAATPASGSRHTPTRSSWSRGRAGGHRGAHRPRDAAPGGSWRYVTEWTGEEYGFGGCCHRSARTGTCRLHFEGIPDGDRLETMWFEHLGDGRTRLHTRSLFDSDEARDGMLSSGMDVGVNDGYARLDALLAEGAA